MFGCVWPGRGGVWLWLRGCGGRDGRFWTRLIGRGVFPSKMSGRGLVYGGARVGVDWVGEAAVVSGVAWPAHDPDERHRKGPLTRAVRYVAALARRGFLAAEPGTRRSILRTGRREDAVDGCR